MASSPVEAAAEAVQQHIGGFVPESAAELDRFLHDLPQLFESTAEALAHLADRFGSDLPVHPSVHEHLRELARNSFEASFLPPEKKVQFLNLLDSAATRA